MMLGRVLANLEVSPRHPPFGPLACFPLRLRPGEAPLPRLRSEDYHAENRDTDAEAAKHRSPLGALPACPHVNVCALTPTHATPLTERSVRRYSDVPPRRRLGFSRKAIFSESSFLGDQDLRRRHNKPTRTSETRSGPRTRRVYSEPLNPGCSRSDTGRTRARTRRRTTASNGEPPPVTDRGSSYFGTTLELDGTTQTAPGNPRGGFQATRRRPRD